MKKTDFDLLPITPETMNINMYKKAWHMRIPNWLKKLLRIKPEYSFYGVSPESLQFDFKGHEDGSIEDTLISFTAREENDDS